MRFPKKNGKCSQMGKKVQVLHIHKYKFLFWKEKKSKKKSIYTIVSAAAEYQFNTYI